MAKKKADIPDEQKGTSLSVQDQKMLWGRSAGRCARCNELVTQVSSAGEFYHIGQNAHLTGAGTGPNTPRLDPNASNAEKASITNFILACPSCHTTIDNLRAEDDFTVDTLQRLKAAHEESMELLTSVRDGQLTLPALFEVRIASITPAIDKNRAMQAIAASGLRYDRTDVPHFKALVDSGTERSNGWWDLQFNEIRCFINDRIRPRLDRVEFQHLSIFAMAPTPLLVALGTCLGDLVEMDVYQPKKEPKTWEFLDDTDSIALEIEVTKGSAPSVALSIETSASKSIDRLREAVGEDCSVVRVTSAPVGYDVVRSREDLCALRKAFQNVQVLLDQEYPDADEVSVFTAASISACVELGRSWKVKGAKTLKLYEALEGSKSHIHVLTIDGGQE